LKEAMKHKETRSGHYERFGEHNHFVPKSLPPKPVFVMDAELIALYGDAMQSLGRLDEVGTRIPSKRKFIDVYVAKEAVLSSDIEGIYTTLTEVLEYKAREKLRENRDVEEVLNYLDAVNHAIDMVQNQGLPVSNRVIRESHSVLLNGARGQNKTPGEYRKVPVFVGELIPPPAHYIPDMIKSLETFINDDGSILPLIKIGLSHVQFETIHPFLDGNGRIGRLLIVLMMLDYGLLKEPILYPSYFFKKYKSEYYTRLDEVRLKGDYESWIKYFLRGIKASADDVVARAWRVDTIIRDATNLIDQEFGKSKAKALNVLDMICHAPIVTIGEVAEASKTTYPPAQKLVARFVELGILEPENDKKRNQRFVFKEYLDELEKN
jgi:Fic family protein